jgi:hypothetical protein
MDVRAERAELMNRLPMVEWDRCVPHDDGTLVAYGWIPRRDGARDFVCLLFLWSDEPLSCTFVTSSATHSATISRLLLGEDSEHVDCKRIADVFRQDVISTTTRGSAP